MPLPNEYVIEKVIKNIDDVVVYRADHTIHGLVNVYMPDETLPESLLKKTRQRLYQKSLKMRELSVTDIPFITKALEVSQNPNEPYIVTQYIEHDLEWLMSNGVTLKPKRMFVILSQILQTITHLTTNGWPINRIAPCQIKLAQTKTGDIAFALAEGIEQQSVIPQMANTITVDNPLEEQTEISRTASTQNIDEARTAEDTPMFQNANPETLLNDFNDPRQVRRRQRGIYLLGNTIYQLLFGRIYDSGDDHVKGNLKRLGARWRNTLAKILNQNIDDRYDTYSDMQADVTRALLRNKRIAAMCSPFLIILMLIGCYFAYDQYDKHKIMTSEAGQAIESFLEIIDETKDDFPEIKKPESASAELDEAVILEPFDEISDVKDN